MRSAGFRNSDWISFQLDGKITSRTLVYFRWFELTASGGVEIWYYLMPLSSAQFCLQWFSPTMVSMVRSYNCFACNRRFGNICSSRWSKWENFITIDLVMPMFRSVYMEIQAGMMFAQEFGLCVLRERSFDGQCHHLWKLWELCNEGCGVLDAFVTFLSRLLEEQVIRTWKFQPFEDARYVLIWFCMPTCLNVSFFETNRKQTTNLYKSVFDVFAEMAVLLLELFETV